jgi:CRISPR-associated protein Cmr3
MTIWIIEPHDPLIVRDGRPFGPDPGARAVSLTFPFPSTTTGAVRTQAGRDADGQFTADSAKMKQVAVRGPLLVEYLQTNNAEAGEWQFLAPAPADALLLEPKEEEGQPAGQQPHCYRLMPQPGPDGAITDLDTKYADLNLTLVGPVQHNPQKPVKHAPAFWRWNHFEQWLTNPPDEQSVDLADLGHSGPTRESRIHIQRDPTSRTAEERKLFETSGLEFTHPGQGMARLRDARRLALAVETDKVIQHPCPVDYLGGERRLVTWRVGNRELPTCPPELREQIIADKACRLILLTPAHFTAGFSPTWLCVPRHGVTATLQAIAIQRPQVVSGWDFVQRKPKPTRRLAPAGSVLFLKLDGDRDAIADWIDQTWMQCVSDDDQDRCDGFGLAVLGRYDDTMTR